MDVDADHVGPVESVHEPIPDELQSGDVLFDHAADEERSELADTVDRMSTGWNAYQTRNVPDLVETQTNDAFDSLAAAVEAEEAADAQQAAVRSSSPASTCRPSTGRL